LFQTVLSSQGYLKVIGIMHLDDILKEFSNFKAPNGEEAFGSEKYWIAVFDTPSADTHWGWQLDGHHLALNFTIADGEIAVTPAFMGTEPHEVRVGPYAGWRILGEEDDQGLAFIKNLDTEQRKQAQLEAEAPRDIFTGPGRGDALKTMSGLPASAMTRDQQGQLLNLIGEYAQNLEHELAHVQMDRIRRAGIENLHFGWMGPIEPGPKDRYYYRIHGPTLLIEFDNSPPPGPGNGDVNHIHSVWRDLENDYGQDLLKQHYETSPHHQN
jgi:hypothetical protein